MTNLASRHLPIPRITGVACLAIGSSSSSWARAGAERGHGRTAPRECRRPLDRTARAGPAAPSALQRRPPASSAPAHRARAYEVVARRIFVGSSRRAASDLDLAVDLRRTPPAHDGFAPTRDSRQELRHRRRGRLRFAARSSARRTPPRPTERSSYLASRGASPAERARGTELLAVAARRRPRYLARPCPLTSPER